MVGRPWMLGVLLLLLPLCGWVVGWVAGFLNVQSPYLFYKRLTIFLCLFVVVGWKFTCRTFPCRVAFRRLLLCASLLGAATSSKKAAERKAKKQEEQDASRHPHRAEPVHSCAGQQLQRHPVVGGASDIH